MCSISSTLATTNATAALKPELFRGRQSRDGHTTGTWAPLGKQQPGSHTHARLHSTGANTAHKLQERQPHEHEEHHWNSSRKDKDCMFSFICTSTKTGLSPALNPLSLSKGSFRELTFYPSASAARALLGRTLTPHSLDSPSFFHSCFASANAHQGPPFTTILFSCNKQTKNHTH